MYPVSLLGRPVTLIPTLQIHVDALVLVKNRHYGEVIQSVLSSLSSCSSPYFIPTIRRPLLVIANWPQHLPTSPLTLFKCSICGVHS